MTKPTLSVLLLRDDTFDEMWRGIIKNKFEQQYNVRFTYFKRSSELVRLAREQAFDLIVLYMLNVKWDTPELGEFGALASLKHGKRILVTQGLDYSEQCKEAGVTFFNIPFVLEEFHALLEACLKEPPATPDKMP